MLPHTRRRSPRTLAFASVAAATAVLVAGFGVQSASAASAPKAPALQSQTAAKQPASVTNLDHLNWLLGSVPLVSSIPGHSTYNQSSEPTALAPWVYANHEADGSFQHVGGGSITDAAEGYYSQGAFDADDIARTAVVYVRDWQQNHDAASEQHAYEVLRDLAYLQTSTGPDAGNVVLWEQSDGTLNATPTPADSPNPSDSGESFWLGRTIWAFGEAYGAFEHSNPPFAAFLKQRMSLALSALDRQSLSHYGQFDQVNGARVPAWLITGSTSASAEAALGLDAYVTANPGDAQARTALSEEAQGLADMASGSVNAWPFGAIMPSNTSQSAWNAWGGMAPAALSDAAVILHRPDWQNVAVTAVAQFTAQLLATGGPDNGWTPTPFDTSQIAYGADSLVQSLITVADNTKNQGLYSLAGVAAGWYFGANPANTPVYNPATGVCSDGISATGQLNLNCGAESTIHSELSMLALDAHPSVRALATTLTSQAAVNGIKVVEAESGELTGTASVVVPPAAWTGSANWSGDAYVQAGNGATVTMSMPNQPGAQNVYPVVDRGIAAAGSTSWSAASGTGRTQLGSTPNGGAGSQGIAPTPTVLRPLTPGAAAPAGTTTVTAKVSGSAQLDAILVQPVVSHLALGGPNGQFDLYVSASKSGATQAVVDVGRVTVSEYDSQGRLIYSGTKSAGPASIPLAPGGFTTVTAVSRGPNPR